jgi:hypothetical protein
VAMLGPCVLFVCHDYDHADEADFNEWYIREHLPERANGLPGFHRGRRFIALGDAPKYVAFYETERGALASEAYLKIVGDPDPRSRQFIPRFQNPSRTVFAVRASAGVGEGGVLGLLAFDCEATGAESLRKNGASWVKSLQSAPGIIAAHLLEVDPDTLDHSRQGHMRTGDRILPWALLIEALSAASISRLRAAALSPHAAAQQGVGNTLISGDYRVLCSLRAGG